MLKIAILLDQEFVGDVELKYECLTLCLRNKDTAQMPHAEKE